MRTAVGVRVGPASGWQGVGLRIRSDVTAWIPTLLATVGVSIPHPLGLQGREGRKAGSGQPQTSPSPQLKGSVGEGWGAELT